MFSVTGLLKLCATVTSTLYILVLKGPVPIVFVKLPGAPFMCINYRHCIMWYLPCTCLVQLSRLRSGHQFTKQLVATLYRTKASTTASESPNLHDHTIRPMPKARKKKAPVTTSVASSSSSPHTTRTIIRRFHVLLKRQEQLKRDPSTASHAAELRKIEKEIEEMGGLAAYQHMSDIGQGNDRGGGSEKVLIKWLTDMGFSKPHGTPNQKRLLEVGALKPDNYASCSSWIDVTPIDLRSRHAAIREQDFLEMGVNENQGRWDIISLSLVVNFVPEPRDRGRMLCLAHAFLREAGLLFLVLPLPCVENSRYLTFELLQSLMTTVGFVETHKKWKQGGKMAYWLYRKVERHTRSDSSPFRKRTMCRQGSSRNNFVILVQEE